MKKLIQQFPQQLSEAIAIGRANKINFDSSNSNYQIIKWKKECKVLEQEYFDVMNEGAVELIL